MAAQLEIPADALDHAFGGGRVQHPLLEHLFAQALLAGADQDDRAAVLHGVLGVVQRLLGLIEVQVLRRAALADQHDVRAAVQFLQIHFIQEPAALAVRLDQIASHRAHDLLVLVQHHVDDEVHAADLRRLLQILPQRVRVQIARVGLLANHHAVVALDGLAGGHAGHDGLRAAGIACKVVILDVAQADAPVGLGHGAGDVHRRARVGDAHVHAVGAVGIHTADFIERALAGQLLHLLGRMAAMAAQREHQRHVLGPAARGVQLVQQRGQDAVARAGAGDVAGDDGDLFAGMHDLLQPRRADGVFQRAHDLRLVHQLPRNVVGHEHAHQIFVRHLDGLHARAESEFKFHANTS